MHERPQLRRKGLLAGMLLSGALVAAWAQGNDRVAFPASYERGVHYATVERGGIREELFTSRQAIEAARRGEPLPDGTVITMEDHRDGALFRYVVMEKRAGWGQRYADDVRNGDWEYQSFRPDRTVNRTENVSRCMGCHKNQASQDFVFTQSQIKSASTQLHGTQAGR